jgi:holo-[acyl-carrier protein] synthase
MQIFQGIDLVKVERIKKIYSKFEYRFLEKLFSKKEIEQIVKSGKNEIIKIAGKFSCKEAAAKALGTGISKGLTFKDFEILTTTSGQPKINLKGKAKKIIQNIESSNVSISHDGEYLVSVVTFLAEKK